ncbi:hypothetical protein L195_g044694, partial [Trifolium pratense]
MLLSFWLVFGGIGGLETLFVLVMNLLKIALKTMIRKQWSCCLLRMMRKFLGYEAQKQDCLLPLAHGALVLAPNAQVMVYIVVVLLCSRKRDKNGEIWENGRFRRTLNL